jgi:uncharacterized protein (TIGR00288 family)
MKYNMKIAVLIDGENTDSTCLEAVLLELESIGEILIKRIYGDWSNSNLFSWRYMIHKHAIKAIHQYSNIKGKNTSDSALIIDAMDILYSGSVDCYCIVTSDSDFTGLVLRLREEGKFVIGAGKDNTHQLLKESCNSFINISIKNHIETKYLPSIELLNEAFQLIKESKNGIVKLSVFYDALKKKIPGFNFKAYGFKKFKNYCESLHPHYTIQKDEKLDEYIVIENPNFGQLGY